MLSSLTLFFATGLRKKFVAIRKKVGFVNDEKTKEMLVSSDRKVLRVIDSNYQIESYFIIDKNVKEQNERHTYEEKKYEIEKDILPTK